MCEEAAPIFSRGERLAQGYIQVSRTGSRSLMTIFELSNVGCFLFAEYQISNFQLVLSWFAAKSILTKMHVIVWKCL